VNWVAGFVYSVDGDRVPLELCERELAIQLEINGVVRPHLHKPVLHHIAALQTKQSRIGCTGRSFIPPQREEREKRKNEVNEVNEANPFLSILSLCSPF